jgi:hypothetical protein
MMKKLPTWKVILTEGLYTVSLIDRARMSQALALFRLAGCRGFLMRRHETSAVWRFDFHADGGLSQRRPDLSR